MDELYTIALSKYDLDRLFVVLDDAIPHVQDKDDQHALHTLRSLVMRADEGAN